MNGGEQREWMKIILEKSEGQLEITIRAVFQVNIHLGGTLGSPLLSSASGDS